MTVGEKIGELLDWSGMSQGELSKRSGIPQTTISSYVTGKATVPVDAAYKIASGLGVSAWTVLNCEPLPATMLDMSEEEVELVTDVRQLTRHQREIVLQVIKLMRRQNTERD